MKNVCRIGGDLWLFLGAATRTAGLITSTGAYAALDARRARSASSYGYTQ